MTKTKENYTYQEIISIMNELLETDEYTNRSINEIAAFLSIFSNVNLSILSNNMTNYNYSNIFKHVEK
jgi:hypothetical protein